MKKPTRADIIRAKNEIGTLEVCTGLSINKNPERIILFTDKEHHEKIREIATRYGLKEYLTYEDMLIFGYD